MYIWKRVSYPDCYNAKHTFYLSKCKAGFIRVNTSHIGDMIIPQSCGIRI